MKILIPITLLLVVLSSCSTSSSQNIVKGPVLVEEKSLPDFTFKDQFGNSKTIDSSIEKLILAFEEEPAHAVNDYLANQSTSFLKDNKTLFIADISAAPGIIQKMFILPGLKKYKYSVLIFTDEEEAAPFREGINVERIIVVYLKDKTISSVKTLAPTTEEVRKMFFEK